MTRVTKGSDDIARAMNKKYNINIILTYQLKELIFFKKIKIWFELYINII